MCISLLPEQCKHCAKVTSLFLSNILRYSHFVDVFYLSLMSKIGLIEKLVWITLSQFIHIIIFFVSGWLIQEGNIGEPMDLPDSSFIIFGTF